MEGLITGSGAFVHLASYITACAMSNLCSFCFLHKIPQGNVKYGDTDSLVIAGKVPEECLTTNSLGGWSAEYLIAERTTQ